MLSDSFQMEVANRKIFNDLSDFAAFSKTRQKGSKKTHDRFDEVPNGPSTIVYCSGTMAGSWLNGSSFEKVRFIDRFVVQDGKIADMKVWSDMGEFRPRAS